MAGSRVSSAAGCGEAPHRDGRRGYLPAVDYLEDLTRIIDELSALDLGTTVPPGAGDGPGDLDRLAMRVAVGTYRHSRLLVALLQLGHASHSIRRYDPQA